MDTGVISVIGGLAIPILAISLPIFIVAIVMYARHADAQRRHETISRMIEKGLPVPPELLRPQHEALAAKYARPSSVRTAFTLIGLGIGLIIFFVSRGGEYWGLGAIPLAIGLAQWLAWKLEQPQPDAADRDQND